MAECKKSRKLGRNSKRPSQQSNRSELRMQKNKRLNIQKAEKQKQADAHKVIKVAKGTARYLRRQRKEYDELVA